MACANPSSFRSRNHAAARRGRQPDASPRRHIGRRNFPCRIHRAPLQYSASRRRQRMRVGLFYQIQVPKPWTPSSEAERIYEALEQIPYAEQQGFESVWFSEHHFRPVWSHNSAPDLTLAAVSQRTSRIRLGVGVVLAPIHHPLHVAQRMATLDILSHGRVDVGLGRTGYPYQLTPYGSDLRDTRGMWQEFAELLPRLWTEEEVSHDGRYYQIPRREVLPKAGAAAASAAVVGVRQRRD